MSLDPECDPDIVAMIGVSAALALSEYLLTGLWVPPGSATLMGNIN